MLSIKEILVSLGIISDQINTKDQAVIIVLIISLAFISDFVCKKIALIFLHIHAKLTNRPQEEEPLKVYEWLKSDECRKIFAPTE